MGGYGSGSHTYNKRLVEYGNKICVNSITRNNYFKEFIKKEILYFTGNIGPVNYEVFKNEGDCIVNFEYDLKDSITNEIFPVQYSIKLIPLERYKRGEVYLFECPLCRKNRGFKLYNSGSNYFACRECLNLNYQSTRESRMFDKLYRQVMKERGCSMKKAKKFLLKQII